LPTIFAQHRYAWKQGFELGRTLGLFALICTLSIGVVAGYSWRTRSSSPTVAYATSPDATPPAPASRDPQASNKVTTAITLQNITYSSPGGMPLKMDLHLPGGTGAKPAPVVLYLHGGAWQAGSKSSEPWMKPAIDSLVANGFAVAAVDYRLAPQYKWPAQIEDAKSAVRYLRANAATYNLDSNAIGALGVSAGGHLAALLGTTDASAGLEGSGGNADQSSRVQAVVDIAGPADLTVPSFDRSQGRNAAQVFGATRPGDPVLARASPVAYVTADDPPFLIIHGEKDSVVPPSQSQELYDRLRAAGVPATLLMVQNAEHTLTSSGGPIEPTQARIVGRILQFLDSNLKTARNP
jgi:acetyl esterase/lipase